MMAKPPAPNPAAGTPGPVGAVQPTAYQQMHDSFSQADPPDPTTFLKMIWDILTPHQKDLITALLKNPQAAGAAGGAGATGGAAAQGGSPRPIG